VLLSSYTSTSKDSTVGYYTAPEVQLFKAARLHCKNSQCTCCLSSPRAAGLQLPAEFCCLLLLADPVACDDVPAAVQAWRIKLGIHTPHNDNGSITGKQ
jgi:hypothetical protein